MTPAENAKIDEIAASARPLIVCDVDEVVLEFVAPFMAFLNSRDHELRTTSFRLTGNIYANNSPEPSEKETVSGFIEEFFAEHDGWQSPVGGARESLLALQSGHDAEIVFLTAMPPRHHARRRALLDSHGLLHPMIATESAKGDAVGRILNAFPERPVAFIDDLPKNHVSVRNAVPGALTLHMMAYAPLREHLPSLPRGVVAVDDWAQAEREISGFFGTKS